MSIRTIWILLVSALFLSTCSFDSPAKREKAIAALEAEMEQKTEPGGPRSAKVVAEEVHAKYLEFVTTYPKHEKAPDYLYRAAMIQADRKQQYQECIKILERVRREYPSHQRAENALFLIGYTYAEHLSDLEKAKQAYEAFLQQYPQSDLKMSVEFELRNLGKPIEELDIFKTVTTEG